MSSPSSSAIEPLTRFPLTYRPFLLPRSWIMYLTPARWISAWWRETQRSGMVTSLSSQRPMVVLSWSALVWAQGKRDAELAVHAARPGEPSFSAG